jgi:integrase
MRGRSGRITLSQYIDLHYWPVAQKRLAATSLDTYEKEIRLRIRPRLGNVDIRDIDRVKIQKMVDTIPTESVARKCVSTLKTILNSAKGDGLIIANPAEATFAMPQKSQKRDNGLVLTTFDQIRDLLSIVRQNGSQSVQRIAYTGLLQGLRPEERYALDWSDIDVDNATISVSKAYVASSTKHGGERLKSTKTEKSTRVIPMHPDFTEWVDTLPRDRGPFILGANGQRISPSTAQKQWRRFLADNPSANPVTIENMRHSFATSYLHAGGQVADLSLMLGHADINTTLRRYVRPNVDDLRRGMLSVSECK